MNERLTYLFEKYYARTISPSAKEELLSLMEQESNQHHLKELIMSKYADSTVADSMPAEYSDAILEAIFSTTDTTVKAAPTVHRIHFLKTSWLRYAAAVILMLGVGSYLWFSNKKTDLATTNDSKHLSSDVAPGTNKAVLTLADGTKIVLDNTANGNVAQQGNTKIIKLDAGQLVYQQQGKALSEAEGYNTISTPRGGQYQIVLPDGSHVWLNAASSIKFPATFTGATRDVEVTGEAYLEIAKNVKQPFTVNTNGMQVQVLGTSFNINAYSDEESIRTTLIDGSVRVSSPASPVISKERQDDLRIEDASGATEKSQQLQGVILKPGQQAVVVSSDQQQNSKNQQQKGQGKITVQAADIAQVLAWKNGLFHFDGTDLKTIMRELARWYNIEVSFQGNVPNRRLTGEISRDIPLSSLLKALELSKIHFSIEEEGKKIIVKP